MFFCNGYSIDFTCGLAPTGHFSGESSKGRPLAPSREIELVAAGGATHQLLLTFLLAIAFKLPARLEKTLKRLGFLNGSRGRARTYNITVNSRALYH
jgi:hypothetical protein